MFGNKECSNGTEEQGCRLELGLGATTEELDEWLEETVWYGMRMWHVIFLSIGAVLTVVILLCSCFKFRIPRTKQEIEGDYIRRKIMRKFRKRLKAIQNQELDEMDLKKALDKIRTELKSDTESLQQSDVLSGATLSSAGGVNPAAGSTYRRASQIQIDISLEDLRIQSMGLGARIALAFTRFFGGSKKAQPAGDSDEENGGNGMGDVGIDKPTTALLPPKKPGAAASSTTTTGVGKGELDTNNEKKKDKDEQKGKVVVGTDPKIEAATTSKEKSTKTLPGKTSEQNKKDKKKEPTNTTTPATTVTVTTEKETGSSDKKQDKKTSNNKEDSKGKKEKDLNKCKTGGTVVATPVASKDEKEKLKKGPPSPTTKPIMNLNRKSKEKKFPFFARTKAINN